MLEQLKDYGQRILKNMSYENVKLEIKFDENLDVAGKIIAPTIDFDEIDQELEDLRHKLHEIEQSKPKDANKQINGIIEGISGLENLTKLIYKTPIGTFDISYDNIPHKIEIKINPMKEKSEKSKMETLEHELGHYYLERKHPKFSKIFRFLRKPERYLDSKFPNLSAYVGATAGVLTAITSVFSSKKFNYVPYEIPIILMSISLVLALPYAIEEKLATHYGKKYIPK